MIAILILRMFIMICKWPWKKVKGQVQGHIWILHIWLPIYCQYILLPYLARLMRYRPLNIRPWHLFQTFFRFCQISRQPSVLQKSVNERDYWPKYPEANKKNRKWIGQILRKLWGFEKMVTWPTLCMTRLSDLQKKHTHTILT